MRNSSPPRASALALIALLIAGPPAPALDATRPRARDIGLTPGILPTGPLNAITDVEGVRVGQVTIIQGENVRTGVTAILPHGGDPFQEKVPGAVVVATDAPAAAPGTGKDK